MDSDAAGYSVGERLVFEVTMSDEGTGSFIFTLRDNLDHAPGGFENDISLSFNYTATDADGDPATGSFLVDVDDDMPVVDLAPAEIASITLDETEGDTDDALVLPASILAQVTASGASLFTNSTDFGADGPADSNATVFSLVFNGTFDSTPVGIKDTATDEDIVIINNGGVFEGRTTTTNLLVFTIAVDAGDGDITVTQHRAVKHGDSTDHDEADTPEIMDAGLISLKVALTDDDGDGAADSSSSAR